MALPAATSFLNPIDGTTTDLVEYRVKPITRYVVTRHERRTDPRYDRPIGQTTEKGTFDNPTIAFEVAYALCKDEHDRLGWPVGDERIQYPKGDPRYPADVVGTDEDRAKAIKQLTARFLQWKLPANFHPDGGITFEPRYQNGTPNGGFHTPIGTNLLDYGQAKDMLEHLLEGLVITPAPVQDRPANT